MEQHERSYSWLMGLIVLMTLVLIATGLVGHKLIEERLVANAGEEVAGAAAEIAQKLDLLLFERYGDIQVLAETAVWLGHDRTQWARHLAFLNEAYPIYLWLGLVDPSGRVLAATNRATVGADVGGAEWFTAVSGAGRVYVQDVARDALAPGFNSVGFAAPVVRGRTSRRLDIQGVVATRVGLPRLEEIVTDTLHSRSSRGGYWANVEYQLLDHHGAVFVESNSQRKDRVNLRAGGLASAELVQLGKPGYVEEEHLRRHVQVITGYAPLPRREELSQLRWGVLVRVDREAVLDPVRSVLWKAGLWGAALVLPILACLLWATRQLRNEWQHERRMQASLRESQSTTQAIVTNALDAHILMDQEGLITAWNPQAERIFGWAGGEVMGRRLADVIVPPDFREAHERGLRHFLTTGVGRLFNKRVEISGWHREGREFPVELSITPILSNGRYTFSAFVRDISERKLAEAEQVRLLTVLNASLNEIYMFRTDTLRFTYVNRGALDNLDYTLEAMQALTPIDIEPEMTEASFRELVNPLLTGEQTQLIFQTVHQRKNGSTYPVEVHLQVVGQGTERTFLALIHDVTARRQQERRQAAEHAVTQLLLESQTLEETVPGIMKTVCRTLEWSVGAMWRVDEERQTLCCTEVWDEGCVNSAQFIERTRQSNFAMGIGLPGRVWKSGKVEWIPDVTRDDNFPRAPFAVDARLHAAFAFPIRCNNRVIGVMEFFAEEIRELDQPILDMFTNLGNQISQFLARKQAEQNLRVSETRFAGILDMAEDAIVSVDEACRITLFNQGAAHMFGYAPDEALGQPLNILLPDRFAETHDRQIRALGSTPIHARRMGGRREVIGRRKSGEEFPCETSLSTISVEGKITYTAIVGDIAERKRAERQMKAAKDQAEQVARDKAGILAVVEAFFISVNEEGLVTEWTGQAEKLFGIPLRDALDRSFKELPIRWNWDEVLGAMRQAGDSLKVVRLDKLRVTLGEGKEAFLKMTVSPLCEDRGVGYIFMGEDVTNRLALEHELAQAQKLESIGQLAAGVAHEINTPIQFVGDNIRFLSDSFTDILRILDRYHQLLAAAKAGPCPADLIGICDAANEAADLEYLTAEIPKAITQSSEGVDRVATIVRAMKEFAHPGNTEKVAVNLNKAIESTVTVARNEWKYVADLKTNFDAALPPVLCLVGELNQVVLNMIVNATHAIADAIKGTGEKGTITISTTRADDYAEIRIADTGAGIPEAIRHKIFDPFFTTKEVGKGTGQGLAIARSVVVDKHGGTITVESEVGKGTTFIIRLPLGEQANSEAVERAA